MRTNRRLRLGDIRNTSTFRLTVLFGIIFVLGLVALLSLVYVLSAHELNARTDLVMRQEMARLVRLGSEALPTQIRSEIRRSTRGLNYFLLQSAGGEPIVGDLEAMVPPHLNRDFHVPSRPGAHGPLRALAVRTDHGETIIVARDISTVIDLRWRILVILVGSGLVITCGALTIGVALSLRPLRRIRDLQLASQRIAAGNLSERMPLAGRGDELDLFAATVNTMIAEVGHVVAQVKAVTDAVAHDLRTPLTRVRNSLYRVTQAPDATPYIAGLAQNATDDLEKVLHRFSALLRISELEAGGLRTDFHDVDMSALVAQVCDLYEPVAEESSVRFSRATEAVAHIHGDKNLLFEAISNLVDNAIKFAADGGQVTVRVEQLRGNTIVEVQDDGPGIAPDEHEAVMRRFYRGVGSEKVAGTGLGLSVTSAILHLHNMQLELDDAQPGLKARIIGRSLHASHRST